MDAIVKSVTMSIDVNYCQFVVSCAALQILKTTLFAQDLAQFAAAPTSLSPLCADFSMTAMSATKMTR
jgi:hypothetical protein